MKSLEIYMKLKLIWLATQQCASELLWLEEFSLYGGYSVDKNGVRFAWFLHENTMISLCDRTIR